MIIWKVSISLSALILFVLIVRFLFRKTLNKTVITMLWNLVILRAVLPVQIPVEKIPVIKQGTTYILEAKNTLTQGLQTAWAKLPVIQAYPSQNADVKDSILLIWLIGMIMMSLIVLGKSIREIWMMQKIKPAKCVQIEKMIAKSGIRRKIRIYTGTCFQSPVTCGILRPKIILPEDFEDETENHIRYMILHELVHIRRLDVLKRFGMTAAVCVYWFHPLMWIGSRLYRKDQEIACDEQVLHLLDGSGAKAYAETLISMSMPKEKEAILYEGFQKKNAERERIFAAVKNRKMGYAGRIISVLATVLCFTTFISYFHDEDKLSALIKEEAAESGRDTAAEDTERTHFPNTEWERKVEAYKTIVEDIIKNHDDPNEQLTDEQQEAFNYHIRIRTADMYLKKLEQGQTLPAEFMDILDKEYPDRGFIKKK